MFAGGSLGVTWEILGGYFASLVVTLMSLASHLVAISGSTRGHLGHLGVSSGQLEGHRRSLGVAWAHLQDLLALKTRNVVFPWVFHYLFVVGGQLGVTWMSPSGHLRVTWV